MANPAMRAAGKYGERKHPGCHCNTEQANPETASEIYL